MVSSAICTPFGVELEAPEAMEQRRQCAYFGPSGHAMDLRAKERNEKNCLFFGQKNPPFLLKILEFPKL